VWCPGTKPTPTTRWRKFHLVFESTIVELQCDFDPAEVKKGFGESSN
jgi:hypothetical protein